MKKILFYVMAVVTLWSCTKENDGSQVSGGDGKFALAIKVEQGKFTRAAQTPGSTGQSIQSMIIEVFDGAKTNIGSHALSSAEITAVTNPTPGLGDVSRIVIEGVDSRASYVKIWAFQKSGFSTLPTLNNSINDYQMAFDEIPFFPVAQTAGSSASLLSTTDASGFITINKDSAPAPGPGSGDHTEHKVWTVQATLAPYLARFELKPQTGFTPKTAPDSADDNDVFPAGTSIAITGIYMNNLNDVPGATAKTLNTGNLASWGAGDWAEDNNYYGLGAPSWSNMYNAPGPHATATALAFGANADCYNLYAQSGSPHAIVRVLITLPAGSAMAQALGTTYYGFITISDFAITSGGTGMLSTAGVQSGKLYKVVLDMTIKPSNVTSDPESKAADLYAQVTIEDWVEIGLTPEL